MWAGPNRAPGREETPASKGIPTTAMSAEPTSSIRGSWAKVDGPAKRGTWVLSTWPTWSPSTMRGRESGMRLALRELLDGLRLGLAVADDLPVGRGVRVLDDLRRRAL